MIHDPPLLFQMGPAPVLPFVLLRRPLLLSALTSSSSPPPPLPSSLLPSLSTLSTASLPDSLARPPPPLTHPPSPSHFPLRPRGASFGIPISLPLRDRQFNPGLSRDSTLLPGSILVSCSAHLVRGVVGCAIQHASLGHVPNLHNVEPSMID
ncbi:hypothetical protein BO86DRAFT_7641 [Aspergillus japonicus CBS 114.51]|uniref:Uncharacterized protein n=1 Tax=Aspergillus japonicus CBS 114.51 TaxID=1448312 RepID=A0A8T8XHU7_ASPJA|nr:hypothetical protein BO86DRAFT_7641 [Aspergillus japonicus CBS 114.51]RAH87641.1 hypothetical protein BO86DRAFT_7641 [Aspergillus japonicus CBS 114.51]